MPKTKTTKKKLAEVYACYWCAREFAQRTNLQRHLGLVHGIDEDGRPVSDILRAKLRGYNKRPKRSGGSTATLVKTKRSRGFVSTSTSSFSTPQRPRSSPADALGRPPSVSPASSPSRPYQRLCWFAGQQLLPKLSSADERL